MKKLKNEQGYALAIAVLVITILSILGISLMTTTGNSKKMANKEQENQAAYYIAEAGLNLKKAEIKKAADQFRKETAGWKDSKLEEALKQPPKISTSTTYNSKNSNGTNKVFDTNNASAKVTVEYTTESGVKTTTDNQTKAVQNYIYKIKSVGTIDNQKRTITSTMSYDLTVNSEEQAKPDEEIEGYYPIEGIPEASIHALESFSYNQASLSGPLYFGFKNINLSEFFPFNKDASIDSGKYTHDGRISTKLNCANKKCITSNMTFNRPDQVKLYPFPTTDFNELKTVQSNFPSNNKKQLPSGEIINSGTYYINNISDLNGKNIKKNDVTVIIDNVQIDNKLTISGEGNLKIITKKLTTNGGVEINFSNNNLNILSTESLIFSTSKKIASTGKIKLISPNLQLNGNVGFLTENKVTLFSASKLALDTDAPFPNTKVNIFYTGSTVPNSRGGINLKANLDFLNSYFTNFNLPNFEGNVLFRSSNQKNDTIYLSGTSNTFKTLFFYAPNFNLKLDAGKHFKGVMVGKNINIPNGFVSYEKPDTSTSKPPTNGNGGNNGNNTSGSIITNSTFSDALDSGTLEIDNER